MDGRATGRPRCGHLEQRFSGIDPDHVRELPGGPAGSSVAVAARDRGGDRDGAHGPAPRPAVDLPGCLRLPGLRPHGGASWLGPLHACRRRSTGRCGLSVRRMAVQAFPVRALVHACELCDGAARGRRRAVGVQGDCSALEPRRRRHDRARRGPAGQLVALGSRIRRPESCAARAGRGWRAQRHAADVPPRRRAGADRRGEPALSRRRRHTGGRRRDQGHSGVGAGVSRARTRAGARAPEGGAQRGAQPRRAGDPGAGRLRCTRAGVPRRSRRAAATCRRPQHPCRDRPPCGAERNTKLVASSVHCWLRGGAGRCVVAHGTRQRLARRCRLGDARAAVLDRLASALVCDLGAAASGRQR
jgi:hypothetical protein